MEQYQGAAIDERDEEARAQDYMADEVAASSFVDWKEKPRTEWRRFPTRNQDGSNTCVPQSCAKILGVENANEEGQFIIFSSTDLYNRRSNKPGKGMAGPEALDILSKVGLPLEDQLPSQNMNDAAIEKPYSITDPMKSIMDKYRAGGYVQVKMDIDAIADVVLNQKKAVMIFIFAEWNEWTDYPQILNSSLKLNGAPIRHAITVVDAFLHKGVKSLLIEDSWGKFGELDGQRVLSKEFFEARCYFAGYVLDLSNKRDVQKPQPNKPWFKFTRVLTFGSRGPDVVALQNILKFEELFPQNVQSTGLLAQITAKSIKAWQLKHGIMDFVNVTDMRKIRVGDKTIKKLNEIYAQ